MAIVVIFFEESNIVWCQKRKADLKQTKRRQSQWGQLTERKKKWKTYKQ